jgi:tetraacyldisaccharide 4'-kinase
VSSALTRAWLRRGLLARLLWPLSVVYGALAAADRWLYRSGWRPVHRASVPLVVVGNVIAGGAGKTPVVVALARHFRSRGVAVGVISRGYGRRTNDCREVLADSDPRDVGDEPLLIRRATGAPVFVARQRIDAVQALQQRYPSTQLVLADDGLQHHALARDLEICVFDDRGAGNGWLLPAGPLREPWPRPCDLVLHTGARPAFAGFRGERRLADQAVRADGTRIDLGALAAGPVIAVAAIARPEAFFEMLRARGVMPIRCIALPDHDPYDDWQPPEPGASVVCTEKDAAKLWRFAPDAWAVPMTFTPEAAFFAALDAKLSSIDGHQAA